MSAMKAMLHVSLDILCPKDVFEGIHLKADMKPSLLDAEILERVILDNNNNKMWIINQRRKLKWKYEG